MINTKKLKATMVEKGYTQELLSKEIGISKNALNAKINGRSKMYVDEACAICEALQITSDDVKVSIFLPASSQFRDRLVYDNLSHK